MKTIPMFLAYWSFCGVLLAGERDFSANRETLKAKYRRPSTVSQPKENPHTPARENLGKMLFFDPRLSRANSISCASCHNPSFAWGDGLGKAVGFGSKELGRRTPTILNVAWGELYFWDGRAGSLEEQALGPIESPGEMNLPIEQAVERLTKIPGYRPLFDEAYPGEGIAPQTIGKAIATFERTIISATAPFDRWIEGDETAISGEAKRGFDLFNGKANCAACHTGWNFTDDGFHDVGALSDDIGRGKHLPEVEAVRHAFKTPTLRNVSLRSPYLHNGSEKTLDDIIDLYDRGGRVKRPSLAREVQPLALTEQERRELREFMLTLTSQDRAIEIPQLPQ